MGRKDDITESAVYHVMKCYPIFISPPPPPNTFYGDNLRMTADPFTCVWMLRGEGGGESGNYTYVAPESSKAVNSRVTSSYHF